MGDQTPTTHTDCPTLLLKALQFAATFATTADVKAAQESLKITRDFITPDRISEPNVLESLESILKLMLELSAEDIPVETLNELYGNAKSVGNVLEFPHPERPIFLDLQARALIARYSHNQEVGDLDEAVERSGEAIETAPEESELQAKFHSTLSLALLNRASHSSYPDDTDLEYSVEYAKESVERTRKFSEPALLAKRLFHLGDCYLAKAMFWQDRDLTGTSPEDLDEALLALSESKEIFQNLRENNGNHDHLSVGFIDKLGHIFDSKGSPQGRSCEDPDNELRGLLLSLIGEVAEALDGADERDKQFGVVINEKLGVVYQEIYNIRKSYEHLGKSITLGYENLDIYPTDHSAQGELLSSLAHRLLLGYEASLTKPQCDLEVWSSNEGIPHQQNSNHLDESIVMLQRSLRINKASPYARVVNVFTYFDYVLERIPKQEQRYIVARLANILREAVELIPEILLGMTISVHLDRIQGFYDLASYTAAAILESQQDPYEALYVLELGRGILLSLQLPSPETVLLDEYHPHLGREYTDCKSELLQLRQDDASFERRHECMTRLKEALNKIRRIPQFENYERPISKEDSMNIAQDGPIVVLNVNKYRCDAIVISTQDIKSFKIPGLDYKELERRTWEIQKQLANADVSGYKLLHENLISLLLWLWNKAFALILRRLGYGDCPPVGQELPHVWWIPTDALNFVPIHAIGHPTLVGKNVMSRVISSYTPTLKALLHARASWAPSLPVTSLPVTDETLMAPHEVLIVAMKDTPSQAPLDFSDRETQSVVSAFPRTELVILNQPTHSDVIKALEKGPILAHFSCHGETDFDNPSRSQLLTVDWETNPLTVAHIQRVNLAQNKKRPLLAYLSACYAGHGGVLTLLDQGLHLVSACQIAGFAGAIGTLWAVDQEASCKVVEEFYCTVSFMRDRARALHFAVLKLKESTRTPGNGMKGDPVKWAPFVHFGL